jgi:hypothetical protein
LDGGFNVSVLTRSLNSTSDLGRSFRVHLLAGGRATRSCSLLAKETSTARPLMGSVGRMHCERVLPAMPPSSLFPRDLCQRRRRRVPGQPCPPDPDPSSPVDVDQNADADDSPRIHMFDVGGQRSERKKWIHCFERCVCCLSTLIASSVARFRVLPLIFVDADMDTALLCGYGFTLLSAM